MKAYAYSKGAKRRGRKKIENMPREPNGRISRSGVHHEPADIVAIEARMRHTGLSKDKATDQKAATFIGCLNLMGRQDGLSDDQYDALVSFLDLRVDYLKAIKAPDSTRQSGSMGNGSDEITDEYIRWCSRARERYTECQRAIQEAQNENRTENLWAALDYCAIRGARHDYMVPALRIAANALHRFFR